MTVVLRKETNLYDDDAIKAVNDKVVAKYAVSTTPSSTVAKTATVDGNFTLYKNARISVYFENANTATTPTLNVNSTGAKEIWAYGGPLSPSGNTFNWAAKSTIEFVYDGTHWLVADSCATSLVKAYDEKLNQEVVFNKLTNNGAIRGIFMQNNQMYVNMDYLQTGTIKLGGTNNGNGLMVVYDNSGNEIGRWDKDGLVASGNFTLNSGRLTFTAGYIKTMYAQIVAGIQWGNVDANATFFRDGTTGKAYACTTNSKWGYSHVTTNSEYTRMIVLRSGQNDLESGTRPSTDTYFMEILSPDTSSSNRDGYMQWHFNNDFGQSSQEYYVTVGGAGFCIGTDVWVSNAGSIVSGGTTDKYLAVGTDAMTLNMGTSRYIRITNSIGTNTQFDMYLTSDIYFRYSTSYWRIKGANQSGYIAIQSSSSERYKHDITAKISEDLDAHKLYDLDMKQFVFNDDHGTQYADMKGKTLPGFIAEDVAKVYPAAAIRDADGNIESWDERRIIPGMLKLIQEQHDEIEQLKRVIHIS